MRYPPVSVSQMIEADRLAVETYGVVLLQMMENAGRNLAEVSRNLLGGSLAGRRITVLVGEGNKGGGGLAATRHLANAGAEVSVALAAAPSDLGEAPELQRRALARMGIQGTELPFAAAQLEHLLVDADLIVNALIGYNLHGPPSEPVASFIRAANAATSPTLSLDIPSGLGGDSISPSKPTIEARTTLTLVWPKVGLLSSEARPFVGQIYLADIGIPGAVYRAVGVEPGELFSRGPIVGMKWTQDCWEPAAIADVIGTM